MAIGIDSKVKWIFFFNKLKFNETDQIKLKSVKKYVPIFQVAASRL